MEWVKNIIDMNCYWLISNSSLFFCFCLSLRFCIYLTFVSFVSFFCCPICLPVSFSILKVFSVYLSMFFWCSCILSFVLMMLFVFFFVFFCILCSNIFYCWRWCSPVALQSCIQVRPAIYLLRPFLSVSFYSPSFFSGCSLATTITGSATTDFTKPCVSFLCAPTRVHLPLSWKTSNSFTRAPH